MKNTLILNNKCKRINYICRQEKLRYIQNYYHQDEKYEIDNNFDFITFIDNYTRIINFNDFENNINIYRTIVFIKSYWPHEFYDEINSSNYLDNLFYHKLEKMTIFINYENLEKIIYLQAGLIVYYGALVYNYLNNMDLIIYHFWSIYFTLKRKFQYIKKNKNNFLILFIKWTEAEKKKLIEKKQIPQINKLCQHIYYVSQQGYISTYLYSNYSYNTFSITKEIRLNTKITLNTMRKAVTYISIEKKLSNIFSYFKEEESDLEYFYFFRACYNILNFHEELQIMAYQRNKVEKLLKNNTFMYEFALDFMLFPLTDIRKLKSLLKDESMTSEKKEHLIYEKSINDILEKWKETINMSELQDSNYYSTIPESILEISKEFYVFFYTTFTINKEINEFNNIELLVFYASIYPVIKKMRQFLSIKIYYNYLVNICTELFAPIYEKINLNVSSLYFINKRFHIQCSYTDDTLRNEFLNNFIKVYYKIKYKDRMLLVYFVSYMKIYYQLYKKYCLSFTKSLILTRKFIKYNPHINSSIDIYMRRCLAELPNDLLSAAGFNSFKDYVAKKNINSDLQKELDDLEPYYDRIEEWKNNYIQNEFTLIREELKPKNESITIQPKKENTVISKKNNKENELEALNNYKKFIELYNIMKYVTPVMIEKWMQDMLNQYPNSHPQLKKHMVEPLLSCAFIKVITLLNNKKSRYLFSDGIRHIITLVVNILHTDVPYDFWSKDLSKIFKSKVYEIFNDIEINDKYAIKELIIVGITIYNFNLFEQNMLYVNKPHQFKKLIIDSIENLIINSDIPDPKYIHIQSFLQIINNTLIDKKDVLDTMLWDLHFRKKQEYNEIIKHDKKIHTEIAKWRKAQESWRSDNIKESHTIDVIKKTEHYNDFDIFKKAFIVVNQHRHLVNLPQLINECNDLYFNSNTKTNKDDIKAILLVLLAYRDNISLLENINLDDYNKFKAYYPDLKQENEKNL